MKCEACSEEKEAVETLSLCPVCFDKVNAVLENVVFENIFLKLVLKKYREGKT